MLRIGDSVGGIYKRIKNDGTEEWFLCEDKIIKITTTKIGTKYYTKSKFHPLFTDDVDSNTKIQEAASGYILTKEVFGLNDCTRPKVENWIKWANEHINDVKSILQ